MTAPAVDLWLPGIVLPTLNVWSRWHWSKQRRHSRAMAWAVRAAWGQPLPPAPLFEQARIEIERCAPGIAPDPDGLVGGCKGLIDSLLPYHVKRRPYGLGFLVDDGPDRVEIAARSARARKGEAGTRLVLRPLRPSCPAI